MLVLSIGLVGIWGSTGLRAATLGRTGGLNAGITGFVVDGGCACLIIVYDAISFYYYCGGCVGWGSLSFVTSGCLTSVASGSANLTS